MNRTLILLFTLLQIVQTNGQSIVSQDITAKEILLNSIKFAGGIDKLDSIKSAEYQYESTLSDESKISIISKKNQFRKLLTSILADGYSNSTMVFNQGKIISIENDKVIKSKEPMIIDELELQTFILWEYGYYKLGYKLERLEDQKFKHFDCYTLKVISKNGFTTINYFDKSNFKLLMRIYPSGRKTIFTDYTFKEGILINTEIIDVDLENKISTSQLIKLNFNTTIDLGWFIIPNKFRPIPKFIKEGKFQPTNDLENTVTRTSDSQTESRGNASICAKITWLDDHVYSMSHKYSVNAPGNLKTGDIILVKIVTFNKKKYFAHHTSKYGSDANVYQIIK